MRPSLLSRRRVLAGAAASAWLGAQSAHATNATATSAETVLARESAAAAAEDRTLLIAFFASWCVWCRPMDALFEDANTGPIMARHFRVLHFRVGERDAALRALQYRGAEAAFDRITRPERDAGLPYLAILGADGRTISTSRSTVSGENIVCPWHQWCFSLRSGKRILLGLIARGGNSGLLVCDVSTSPSGTLVLSNPRRG